SVILSAEDRAEKIWHDATQLAFAQGLEVVEDRGLLAEVAGLVEWPVVLMGEIGAAFLDLPAEVLQTSMKEHQKFFSVRDKSGRIVKFVTVANIETADNGATILAGNQKVLSARLADAKFFWENDLRVATTDITQWTDALANVTFHGQLGSQQDRVRRIAALAREIAPVVGADPDDAQSAALIAKADLSSEMVYEFPELQGIMGEHYAHAAQFSDEIAAVAREHYQPLGPSDDVPSAPLSVAVALADKIDTLTGFWAIDEKPTGSKDPFALRRAALGVIRLVLENELRFSLNHITSFCFGAMFAAKAEPAIADGAPDVPSDSEGVTDVEDLPETVMDLGKALGALGDAANDLESFFHDRLKVFLRDKGVPHDIIDACLAMPNADDLTLLVKRAEALAAFMQTEDGENLTQGFKRAHNILRQAEEADGVEYSYGPDPKLAETDEEKALFAALDAAEAKIAPAMDAEDFSTAMAAMATLRAPIDSFFEAVQVNAENHVLRRNRLNLLHRISQICLSVADLTQVEG
ncbi:MAG: glycine--tRNA ligase subunit beta, partial [Alphaproteobacteria bacterium]|nr:glycine--tRNA ligase subunit beta [Alphaproteobacteria bacterium]